MSTHIGAERRLRALKPPEVSETDQQPHAVIRIVGLAGGTTALAAVALLSVAFAIHEWRLALLGSTLLIVAAIAGAVVGFHLILADRREFYRRGQLDGWMRGWRGQEPESGDPILRQ